MKKKSLHEYYQKDFVSIPTVFNMNNPYHKRLFEWLYSETTNFSGFLFQTLSMRYEGGSYRQKPKNEDKDLMKGMLS